MSEFTRQILDSLLPSGAVWSPKFEGDLDKYLDGQADNYDPILTFLRSLSEIRNPSTTPLLEELEREYGLAKNDSLTEAQRRAFLESFIFGAEDSGTPEDLERRLQDAGFDVFVYANDPAQDPLVILDQAFRMVAGGSNAFAGRQDAFARRQGGELIVNGDKFKQVPDYLTTAGGPNSSAGNSSFIAGKFDEVTSVKIEYVVPSNPGDWPLIFFIGGPATFDIDGKILAIENIIQPAELRNEFLKIILRYKPLYTWGVSVVDFV